MDENREVNDSVAACQEEVEARHQRRDLGGHQAAETADVEAVQGRERSRDMPLNQAADFFGLGAAALRGRGRAVLGVQLILVGTEAHQAQAS